MKKWFTGEDKLRELVKSFDQIIKENGKRIEELSNFYKKAGGGIGMTGSDKIDYGKCSCIAKTFEKAKEMTITAFPEVFPKKEEKPA